MKAIEKFGKWLILIAFILYGINGQVFERHFFFNEALAFVGILVCIVATFRFEEKYNVFIPDSKIYRLVLLLLGLCIYHLVFSLFFKTNMYFYLRNTVLFYSIFSFFLLFYLQPHVSFMLERLKIPLLLYFLYGLIWPNDQVLDRFNTAAFFPLLFKKIKWWVIVLILGMNILLAKQYSSMTVVLIAALLLGIVILPSFKVFRLVFLTGLTTLILFFTLYSNKIEGYKNGPYSLFGNTYEVIWSDPVFSKDVNSTWRVIFWYRLVKERFPENLIGIGFGTPLLKYNHGSNTVISDHDDLHDIHVSGAHNTYLTMTLRLGLFYLVLMTLIFAEVFRSFYKNKKQWFKNDVGGYYLAFFSVSIIGMFNLVQESPLSASLFWGLLGLLAGAMHQQKLFKPQQ